MLTLTSCFLTLKMTFPVGVTMTSTPLTTVSDNQLALFFYAIVIISHFLFIEIEYVLMLFSRLKVMTAVKTTW